MQTNTINLLLYWRNSLVDGYRLQNLEFAVEATKEALETGKLGPEKTAEIKIEYLKAAKTVSERGKEVKNAQEIIPVLICPIKLVKKANHYLESTSFGEKELIPLWIPAVINTDGYIKPRENHLPWIARNLLEPTTQKGVTIGDIEDIENFLSEGTPDNLWDSWDRYLEYAHQMLKAMPEGGLNLPGYVISTKSYVMPDVEIRGAAMNAIRTLDYVIESKNIPPLLQKYATLTETLERPVLGEIDQIATAKNHCGQMNGKFPLSPSQRESIHHYLTLNNGEILAINGPPGTGKTTLMHSVVATDWVSAALFQEQPPITVVVSANNQAVTNMIDSLGNVLNEDESNPLSMRWIPGINSYGLYCPSGQASQKEESNKYQKAFPGDNNFPAKNGFPGKIEDPEFVSLAENHYLEQCSHYFKKDIKTVKEAIELLHDELTVTVDKFHKELHQYLAHQQNLFDKETKDDELRKKYDLTEEENVPDALKVIRTNHINDKTVLQTSLNNIKQQFIETNKSLKETINLVKEASKPKKTGLLDKILKLFGIGAKEPDISATLQRILQHHDAEIAAITEKQKEISDQLSTEKNLIQNLDIEIAELEKLYAAVNNGPTEPFDTINEQLDIHFRFKAFLLATHYWEGRWLSEVKTMQDLALKRIYLSSEDRVKRKWHRYAMLTPVIVSTLYMTPRLFTVWHKEGENLYSEPLLGYVDNLIVDEAGQVTPELAAATFALAKKAIVVGDVLQIEPIYNITRYVDQGNLMRHGIIKSREDYPLMQSKGITASAGGNLMIVAQNNCPYRLHDTERGMFLSEHRRCLDTIISYCNDLAYNGRLQPMRGNQIKPGGLAPFSYIHVIGKEVRSGSSRKNEQEAIMILDWLIQNSETIMDTYGDGEKTLKELVAVLTPFTAQKKYLIQMVYTNKKYSQLKGITFGTVHALQGSERELIIFSPVYTRENGDPSEFFFNTDVRMLNVAVSRAREAFMVVGDMEIFKRSGGPAGLLAKYLFVEDNEQVQAS